MAESDPPNDQSESETSDKNQFLTPDQIEKEMEVHHHPKVEKKNFKEYLLEFIMIFLAVTMGFIAENIREGVSEHNRGKEFAESMVKDLEADTAQLHRYKSYFEYATNNVDTFMQLLQVSDPKDIPSGKLYWYGLFGGSHGSFVPNDATFQEMKSSGSLRFFARKIETDVAKYDRLCRYLQSIEQTNQGLYTEVRKCRAQFFNFASLENANKIYQSNFRNTVNYSRIDSFMKSNPPLLSNDKILFNQYVELARSRFIRVYNIGYADSIIRQGSLVIGELKEQYSLKDD